MLEDSERLNYEIHAAIHSMLGANIEDLLWTSVGLLTRSGDIQWDSCVNDEYNGNVDIYCPDRESKPLPCKPPLVTNPDRCIVKSGNGRSYVAPPCLKDNIELFCKFREQLSGKNGLEKQTVKKGSLSMSVLSKEYFISKSVHPYITIKDGGFSKHPWIMTKEAVLNDLYPVATELATKKESEEAKEYKVLTEKCMPCGTTAVLIPLIQTHGERKNVYIGAIVICAKAEHSGETVKKRVNYTDIWEHLPRIKATALSLAEVYKHLYGITDDIQKNSISTFLNFLIKYHEDDSWFRGNCSATPPCNIHNDTYKSRHNKDCRLINSGDKMKTFFTENNFELQKSLFATKAMYCTSSGNGANAVDESFAKVGSSYPVPVDQVINFLSHTDFGINCEELARTFNFAWPTSPGLFSFISFLDIYNDLNNYSPSEGNGAEKGVKKVAIEYSKVTNKDVVVFSIVFQLVTIRGTKDLAAKWSGIREGGRRTTDAIKSGMKGIFDKKIYTYDLVTGKLPKTLSEKLMAPTDVPIFYPVFHEDELRLTWIVKESDLKSSNEENRKKEADTV